MQKFRKFSKNCGVKIEVFFIANDKGPIIQNASVKYKLWFKYSGIVKKKFLIALVTQNIKRFFILFLRIIHTDFRSSYLEPPTLKKLHWITFLWKTAYLRTAFLHYTSRYVCVWIKQKKTKLFQNIVLFSFWVAASKTPKVFKF